MSYVIQSIFLYILSYYYDFRKNKHCHCNFNDEKMVAKAWANYLGGPAVTQWSEN